MKGTWFETLRDRLNSTWAVLTGRAYAAYSVPDFMDEVRLRVLLERTRKYFQKNDPEKSGRFSHLTPEEIADVMVAECGQASRDGDQLYADICAALSHPERGSKP